MRHIVLVEDRMSVSNSEHHLEGFLRFRDENPTLRVERHIGLWSNIYYYSWSQLQQLPGQSTTIDGVDEDLYPHLVRPWIATLLPGLAQWFREAAVLRRHAPDFPFSLVLSGYPPEFWKSMRQAAMLQEALTEQYRRLKTEPYQAKPHEPYIHFARPCDVPSEFTVVMKSIMSRRSSTFRVDSDLVDSWDLEAVLAGRAHWTSDMYQSEWKDLLYKKMELPKGGSKALASGYWAKDARPLPPQSFYVG
jgi:hypothetical protein